MIGKHYFLIALLLALVTFVIAQPPQGQGPRGGRPDGPPGPERLAQLLGLTEAQKTQIKAIHEQAETAAKPLHDQLAPLHEQMETLTHAATFDAAAVRVLLTKLSALEVELEFIHTRAENAIFNLYTPEQKAKLEALHKMMEERGPRGSRPNNRQ